jgi:chaperonin GroES
MNIEQLSTSTNIAEELDEDKLKKIGLRCLEDYQQDLQSRKPWEEMMIGAMKIATQMAEKKNTPWSGASNVKFPLLPIASIQFQSRIYPQLFSSPRPVKMRVIGDDPNSEKHDRAARIAEHMSYQVLEQDENWLSEHDKLLITLPIMGSGFIKTYHDQIVKGVHVHAKDLVVNYYAKSLETCSRYTHIIPKYKNEIIEKQRAGLYLDHELHDQTHEKQRFEQFQDENQGLRPSHNDSDKPIYLHEQYCWIDLDEDDYKEPYTVTFDEYGRVFRIVNRFANIERDGDRILKIEARTYFTKYTFIPSPDGGFYDMGFGSLITPINESVNTLINQLIDAGTLNNRQGGFVGRGARLKGGAIKYKMGEFIKVDSTGDDLRKNIFRMPFQEPSNTLFTLLTYLVEYGERLSSVTDMMVGKTPGQNTPATTAMAALEEGMKVFTAIYQRVYRSLKKEYQKRYLLNQEYLDPQEYYLVNDNEKAIYQEDYFGDPTDIRPTADPNMSSEMQRLSRLEAITQRAQMVPGYNSTEIERRFLEQLNMEGIDEIFPITEEGVPAIQPPPDPQAELEFKKFQADQLYRMQEIRIKSALADSEIAVQETQAIMNLAKAESLGNRDEIEGYKALVQQLKIRRELLRDGMDERRFSSLAERADNKKGDAVS